MRSSSSSTSALQSLTRGGAAAAADDGAGATAAAAAASPSDAEYVLYVFSLSATGFAGGGLGLRVFLSALALPLLS